MTRNFESSSDIQDSALQRYFINRIIALLLHFTNHDISNNSICFLVKIIRNLVLACFVGLECRGDVVSFDRFGASTRWPTTKYCERGSTNTNISYFILSYYRAFQLRVHDTTAVDDDRILLLVLLIKQNKYDLRAARRMIRTHIPLDL